MIGIKNHRRKSVVGVVKMGKKFNIYLAGGMEKSENLGVGWRDRFIAEAEKHEWPTTCWNPIKFEKEQLAGLCPGRLPDEMAIRKNVKIAPERITRVDNGAVRYIKPQYWHEFKMAERGSTLYNRGAKYMHRCQDFDLKLISTKMDYLIVNWSVRTRRGAGTYAEIEEAYRVKDRHVPIYIVENTEIPAWIEWRATKIFANFTELYNYLDEELKE